MNGDTWISLTDDSKQAAAVKAANDYTQKFGLVLKEEETSLLFAERREVLKKQQRVEFGEGILPKLIFIRKIMQKRWEGFRKSFISIRMSLWTNLPMMSLLKP